MALVATAQPIAAGGRSYDPDPTRFFCERACLLANAPQGAPDAGASPNAHSHARHAPPLQRPPFTAKADAGPFARGRLLIRARSEEHPIRSENLPTPPESHPTRL